MRRNSKQQYEANTSMTSEISINPNDSMAPIRQHGHLFNLDTHNQLKNTTHKLDEIEIVPDLEHSNKKQINKRHKREQELQEK